MVYAILVVCGSGPGMAARQEAMMRQSVAIFDLDYTLLEGDTESMWSSFLFDRGLVGKDFLAGVSSFYEDYRANRLDIYRYAAFFLEPLTRLGPAERVAIRTEFLQRIRRVLRPKMLRQMRRHLHGGHVLVLITAANNFLAEPIGASLGFQYVISTIIKTEGDVFTTALEGIPAFREGKVQRLAFWMEQTGLSLDSSWGYSDSYNDLPLLELVTHPVAVTPDEALARHAREQGWKIITL